MITAPCCLPSAVFAGLWALALLVTAIWAWRCGRRWTLNTVAGIHFHSQCLERLGASLGTALVVGLLGLGFAPGQRASKARTVRS